MAKIDDKVKSPNYGFPSHMIAPNKKKKAWHLQYVKAFHKEYTTGSGKILRWAFEEYEKYRAYANGRQPIDQYKDMMGIQKNNGKRDPSWRVLDWNILPIMPKFKKIMVNKILENQKRFKIKAVDPFSINQERKQRNEIIEYMANQDILNEVTKATGIGFESPLEEGAPVPQNLREVDMYLDMYPKNRHVLELYDELNLCFDINEWPEVARDIVENLIEVDVAGVRAYVDSNGYIKFRSIMPERLITNAITKRDFSDVIRCGEYIQMTISDLRQAAPKGTFTEEDLAKIANQVAGKSYNVEFNANYFEKHHSYPYDHELITVLDAQWFSADDWAHVISKSNKGNVHIEEKDNPYWLDKKGISDEDYKGYYRQKNEEREIIRNEIKNVYQAMWIVDTEYIFNWGLKTNMQRQIHALKDTKLDYILYSTRFKSIIADVEPILDNIQLNWLQFQHHLAQSRPRGLAIEKSAISMIEIGGKGGLKLSPQNILKMYAETGSYIYKGTDVNGRQMNFKPIEELQGGVSEAAQQHLGFIISNIDLLRQILGINEVSDASSPNPELGKAVANLAMSNTNTALGDFYYAYSSLFVRTGQAVALLIPDAKKLNSTGWTEALGSGSDSYWANNSDKNYMEFGISIKENWGDDEMMILDRQLEASLKAAGGVLLPEDATMVRREMRDNPERAYMMMVAKRRQREQEEEARQMRMYKAEEEKNINSAQAAEQMRQETLALEEEAQVGAHQRAKELITHEYQLKMMLSKLENGLTLNADEALLMKEFTNEMMLLKEKQKGELQKTVVMAKNRPKQTASNSG